MVELKADLSKAIAAIKEQNAKRVILQMPEGLKPKAVEFSQKLEEKTGTEVIFLIDPCFGACDLPLEELRQFKADLIVHVGHNEFMKAGHTLYVPMEYDLSEKEIKGLGKKLVEALKKKKMKRVGLLCTVNFFSPMEKLRKILEKKGVEVFLEKGKRTAAGQLLGCDARAAEKTEEKVDGFVFVGDGLFHSIGVGLTSGKKILLVNPLSGLIGEYGKKERETFIRQRLTAIGRAKQASTFGILFSSKLGQMRLGTAQKIKRLIEKHEKKACLLAGDLLWEDFLADIKVDCFVCTACPRIAVDDGRHWKKPVVNPTELEIALGEKPIKEMGLEPQF
jgi:2-(3-amino-3-carboxypropyl)histidine synthase